MSGTIKNFVPFSFVQTFVLFYACMHANVLGNPGLFPGPEWDRVRISGRSISDPSCFKELLHVPKGKNT
jgi:hypothetical protein